MNQEFEQTFERQAYSEIVKYWHEQMPIITSELAALFELPNNSWVEFDDRMDLFKVILGLGQYYDEVKIQRKMLIKHGNKYRIDRDFSNADIKTGIRYIFVRVNELEVSLGRKWNIPTFSKNYMRGN